jgi:hypothetical protein
LTPYGFHPSRHIAETMRVLLFMTLSILVSNFYPVTAVASLGIFMVPIGWTWAFFVWGYALVWFIINDRVKLPALRILSQHEALQEKRRNSGRREQPPSARFRFRP